MEAQWTIRQYRAEDAALWDRMVTESRQGTFLHLRGYMDYHSDRFHDCSLIGLRGDKPVAILPANITGSTLYSHQGLTYGGWLTPRNHFDGTDMMTLFEAWLKWCRQNGVNEVRYKTVPHLYHRQPAEEDRYALFRYGADIQEVCLSSTIDLGNFAWFNSQQKRYLKKASALRPRVKETADAAEFMPILTDCLGSRHNAAPVHSADELNLLKHRFPDNIRMFMCATGTEAEAEVCVYDTGEVAHCQYIATTEAGRQNGTLTYLMHHLITDVFATRRYFDFGTSNENGGLILNSGLLHQKNGLGGRGVAYETYRLIVK